MNREMLLIVFSLFFLSCEDYKSAYMKGRYYIKTDSPVVISINDKYDNNLFVITNEVDYSFTIYEDESNFLPGSCIKITSSVEQNIHVEMNIKGYGINKENANIFDDFDDMFEYCY